MPDKYDLEIGSLINDVFLVTDAQMLTDKRGRNYYSLKVNLKGGGEIPAKVWSDNIGENIELGRGIETVARVEQYRGEKQLNIQRYSVMEPESFDPRPYVRATDIDVDEAFAVLFDPKRSSFKNPLLITLLEQLHGNESFAAKFKAAPAAAAQHHNYRGGLAEHTLDVRNLGDSLSQNYGEKVDRELVLAGAALHDVGKVHCYTLVSGVSEHTESGMLVDHIFIGASMVSNMWDAHVGADPSGVSGEEARRTKNMLLHLMLSHHGKKEWGAPVLPKTPEAVLLHFCDRISATMRSCFDLLDDLPEDQEWTQWLNIMDEGRKLFCNRDR